MNVGTLCYATNSGLGILAKSFFDAKIISHPFVIGHAHHETQPWYPGCREVGIRDLGNAMVRRALEEWARELDVLLAFETYFAPWLVDHCRRHGVKVVLMPMFECFHHSTPWPDQMWCPSLLDLEVFTQGSYLCGCPSPAFDPSWLSGEGYTVKFTPVPVSVEWRQRTEAKVFVHNGGNLGLKGRNGTREVIEASRHIKSGARIVVRTQKPMADVPLYIPGVDERLSFSAGTVPYEELWATGDVCLFPEGFNGLSLVLQEAYASGMLVMTGARFPNTTYLPTDPLIPVDHYSRDRIGGAYPEFDRAHFDPRTIAAHIDSWYGRDITEYSRQGREWAATMSWDVLKPRYMALLESLVGG